MQPPRLPPWLARLYPFASEWVESGAQRLHVGVTGTGPTVVLLHGNPTWSFLWRNVAARLDDLPVRLVVPDLVGLGLSSKPAASAHTLAAHGAWIVDVLDALAPGPIVFVGQDWGGPIGLRALADRPDRLAGTVILNTVVGPPREGFRPTAFHRFARRPIVSTFAFRILAYPQRSLHLAQGDRDSIRGDVARAYRWPLRRFRDRAAPLALARMVPDSLEHPSVPDLRRAHEVATAFEGPAEIVWGDRDPVLGRARRRVEEALPRARVTRTAAGHFLQEEVPDEIAAAVRRVATAAFGL